MSIVVAPSLPWPAAQLKLTTSTRWKKLIPLFRSSIKTISLNNTTTIFIDTAEVDKYGIHIVVVSDTGHVAEAFLSGSSVMACVVVEGNNDRKEESGGVEGGVEEVVKALVENGVGGKGGLVLVRTGRERRLGFLDSEASKKVEGGVVEVVLEGEMERGHLVALLDAVDEKEKKSISNIMELLKHFIRTSKSTTTTFHSQKINDKIAIVHAGQHEEFETAKNAIEKDLTNLLKEHTKTIHDGMQMTYSVHYADINGLSKLESWILGYEVSTFLDAQSTPHHLTTSSIIQPTLESRGYTISLCPILQSILPPISKPPNTLSNSSSNTNAPSQPNTTSSTKTPSPFTDASIRKRLRQGCNALITAEPEITKYDTIVGDGDCGLTLRSGAQKVLSLLSSTKDLTPFPHFLTTLVDELEVTMGGTSGALYCIFLSSLSQTLSQITNLEDFPTALHNSLTHLLKFTSARLGDRTLLDALIPFIETFGKEKGDVEKALEEARKGVEATKVLEAKLGRSTYLDEKATRGTPDPGAVGVLVLLEGLCLK